MNVQAFSSSKFLSPSFRKIVILESCNYSGSPWPEYIKSYDKSLVRGIIHTIYASAF